MPAIPGLGRLRAAVTERPAPPRRRALAAPLLARVPARVRWDLLALAVLGLALVVYYWPVFFGGKLVSSADNVFYLYAPWSLHPPPGYVPHNTAMTDATVSLAPAFTWVRNSLWNGQLPLWNPHTELGNPFFAQSQWGVLSP